MTLRFPRLRVLPPLDDRPLLTLIREREDRPVDLAVARARRTTSNATPAGGTRPTAA